MQVTSDLRAEARENVDFGDAGPYARVRFRPCADPVGGAYGNGLSQLRT